jgi:hypothetical protein
MRLVLRKLNVEDPAELSKLIADNVEGIEPGLRLVDSRLLLGHATIDFAGVDGQGGLVLIVVGFKADESLLLRTVEAYSWCLEYPDSVRRHYPTMKIAESWPPRMMFVIERVPDAFQRKVKQLNFAAVDLIEFRHLDVNGVPAMYFESVARLRRGAAGEWNEAPVPGAPRPLARPDAVVPAVPPPAVASAPAPAPAGSNGHDPVPARMIEIPSAPIAAGIAGGSDAVHGAPSPVEDPAADTSALDEALDAVAARLAAVEAAEAAPAGPVAAAEPAAVAVAEAPGTSGEETDPKYLFAEAAKASRVAQDFGIQLPKDGVLTRQWVDFLNQLQAK